MRILLILSAITQFLSPMPVLQANPVLFTNNTTRADFPTTLTFSASINSDSDITEVELIYGVKQATCGDVQANAFPEINPGKQVKTEWEWDMRESGSLPPGAEIWWQWKATTESGDIFTSERQTVIWLDSVNPWKLVEEENIKLHYYQIPTADASALLSAAIGAEKLLKDSTGMAVNDPIDLYIYPNSTEMTDAILYEPGWAGGMAFSEQKIVILGAVVEDMEWTKRTVAHELTHILVGNFTFSCLWTTPTWLEEGLAVMGEGAPDTNTVAQFDSAVKADQLLSFHILSASFSEDPSKADLSYSQSYYMVNYLTETYGREKINLLLTTLAKGMTVDNALLEVYGFDLNGFEKEWRASKNVPALEKPAVSSSLSSTPTVIPTLQPVTGAYKPVVAPQVPAESVSNPEKVDGTPTVENSANDKSADSKFGVPLIVSGVLLACLVSLIVLGIIIFFLVPSKNKKKGVITAIAILFVTSAGISLITGKANGQSAQATQYPQLPTATQYAPPTT
ncbi:MAG: peptidase MA family metallohydrolase, partial [Leptolinea sp.]